MRFNEFRVEFDGLTQARGGFVKVAQFAQHDAQCRVCFRRRWFELERLAQGFLCFFQIA